MKLIIVSGLSGSGKTIALNTLEDLGYYCVDNLPVSLLQSFSQEIRNNPGNITKAAVGVDVRNLSHQFEHFNETLDTLAANGMEYEVLFLRCDQNVLLKRYSETRRKHPLSDNQTPLADAITHERSLLEPIANKADLTIDSSNTNVHQLRDLIQERMGNKSGSMSLLFESFGYKRGIPTDADFVFDVRCLPNPHWDTSLRPHTGQEQPVIDFLESQPAVNAMYEQIRNFLVNWIPAYEKDGRNYLTVAIGCTGGKHRSVYLTEKLYRHFSSQLSNVVLRHRELS
ncbi:MAG: RNase adapter RapZ [Gammaproteobacteria bacterium]